MSYGTGNHVLAAMRGEEILPFRVLRRVQMPATEEERPWVFQEMDHSAITHRSLHLPEVLTHLHAIAPLFAPFGCIEFHGCQVGRGDGDAGRAFLHRVANIVKVPAVGAKMKQRTNLPVRYRGPVELGIPAGKTLKGWASALDALRECA